MGNKYCPICGKENNCMAKTAEHGNCWCDKEKFPAGIFEVVPQESLRKQCICKDCLEKFKEENQNS